MAEQEKDKFTIEKLNLYYSDFHALHDVNMHIKKNKITAFIGPSTVIFSCPTNTPTRRTLVTVPNENFPILSLPSQNPAKSVRKIASSGCTLS